MYVEGEKNPTCSLCIGTFGADIIVIIDVVNFIVAVTVITTTHPSAFNAPGDRWECVIRRVSC